MNRPHSLRLEGKVADRQQQSLESVRAGEYHQTPEELARYQQFSMCINCMLCYAACPVYGLEPRFLGPAAIALAQRYNLDSRDGAQDERAETVASTEGIWECTFIGECSRVCGFVRHISFFATYSIFDACLERYAERCIWFRSLCELESSRSVLICACGFISSVLWLSLELWLAEPSQRELCPSVLDNIFPDSWLYS